MVENMKTGEEMNLQALGVTGLLALIYVELVKTRNEVKGLRSLVEKALRPVIRFKIKGQRVQEIKMKDTEKQVASLEIDDAKGFPTGAGFDQAPVWSIDDTSIATLNPSADGMTCEVVGQKPGNAQLSVAGVAGGTSYVGAAPVVVTAGDAATIKVTLGDAVAQ
jgi:hypothetical protein